jgi:hypothetical protein
MSPLPEAANPAPANDKPGMVKADLAPPANGALPAAWLQIVAHLKSQQPALGSVLEHGMPFEISATKMRLGFPENSFFGRQAQSTACREAILKTAEVVLGARPELVISNATGERTATVAELNLKAKNNHEAERRRVALSHPSVRDAIEVFEEVEQNVDVQVERLNEPME